MVRFLLCFSILTGIAHAQRNPAQDDFRAFYGDDRDAERKIGIERIMGVYEVLPPMRHPSETIDIRGGQVRLNLWVPVGRQSDQELVARAIQWLIFGRNRFAQGARGLFEDPDVDEVILAFHEVIRPDQKGRRLSQKSDEIKAYLAIKLDRKRFERLSLGPINECIERTDCDAVFKTAFAAAKLDKAYTRAKRQDE